MASRVTIWIGLILVVTCAAQEKWVWNGKIAKAVRTSSGQPRYGIYEPEEIYERPYRPANLRPPPDLPPLVKPAGNYYPGENGPPARYPTDRLPVPPPPPYDRPGIIREPRVEDDPTRFQKCKCTHAFNCKSPGLLFGSCDAGKKYCCEKSPNGGGRTDYVPNNQDPEVLAGPGGPVDDLRKPSRRPELERPSYGERPGQGRPQTGSYGLRPDGSLGKGPDSYDRYGIRPRY